MRLVARVTPFASFFAGSFVPAIFFMVNFLVLVLVEISLELVSLVSSLLPLWELAF